MHFVVLSKRLKISGALVEAEFWELAVRVIEVAAILAMVPLEMRAISGATGDRKSVV